MAIKRNNYTLGLLFSGLMVLGGVVSCGSSDTPTDSSDNSGETGGKSSKTSGDTEKGGSKAAGGSEAGGSSGEKAGGGGKAGSVADGEEGGGGNAKAGGGGKAGDAAGNSAGSSGKKGSGGSKDDDEGTGGSDDKGSAGSKTESKSTYSGSVAKDSNVCVDGFCTFGDATGYAFSYPYGKATITPDTSGSDTFKGKQVCVNGSIPDTYDDGAGLGVNINQEKGASSASAVSVTSLSIEIAGYQKGMRVQLAVDSKTAYCADLASGKETIDVSTLATECWGSDGEKYTGQKVASVQILVPGTESGTTDFDFCLVDLKVTTGSGTVSPSGGAGGSSDPSGEAGGSTGKGGATKADSGTPGGGARKDGG